MTESVITASDWQEAARLYLAAQEDENAMPAFRAWVGQDPAREEVADALRMGLAQFDAASFAPQINQWRLEALQARPTRLPLHSRWKAAMSGIALSGAVAAGVSVLFFHPAEYSSSQAIAARTVAAEAGQRKTIHLEDGSTIIMDGETSLELRFSSLERDVVLLHGTARFQVAKDRKRPFHVRAGELDVKALGTDFHITAQQAYVQVSLIHGSVLVSELTGRDAKEARMPQAIARLEPGEQLQKRNGEAPHLRKFDEKDAAAWNGTQIEFDDASLAEAASIFNRHALRPISVAPSIADRRISGAFDNQDALPFADAVATMYPDVEVKTTPQRIELSPRQKN